MYVSVCCGPPGGTGLTIKFIVLPVLDQPLGMKGTWMGGTERKGERERGR